MCSSFHPTNEAHLAGAVADYWQTRGVKTTVRRVGTALHKGFIGKVSGEVSLRRLAEFPYGRYGTGIGNDDVPMRDIAAIYGNLPEPDPPPDFGDQVLDRLAHRP